MGEFIYEFVEGFVGDEQAHKITGMLIDLPQPEIIQFLTDFGRLQLKIGEAVNLLKKSNK